MEFRIQTSEGLNNLCSNFRADDFHSLPFVLTNVEGGESVKKEDGIVNSREIVSEPQPSSAEALRFVTSDRNHSSFKGLTVVD